MYLFGGAFAAPDGSKTVVAVRERFLREELLHPLLPPVPLEHSTPRTPKKQGRGRETRAFLACLPQRSLPVFIG